jgi:hypothetical protein
MGRDARIGRVARSIWVLLLFVIAIQAVAVLVGYSPFPWGSYELTFEEMEESDRYPAVVSKAGIAQAMGSLTGTLLLIPVGIALVRAGRVAWWAVPAAVIGDAVYLLHHAGVLDPGSGLVPRVSGCSAETTLGARSPADRSGVRRQSPYASWLDTPRGETYECRRHRTQPRAGNFLSAARPART